MKATLTVKKFEDDQDFVKWNLESIDVCDEICLHLAKYWSAQNRTYLANGSVTIDTVSIHSNGVEIGLRFYYKNGKINNRRKALYYQQILDTESVIDAIETSGIQGFCDSTAENAVVDINRQLKY